MRLHNGFHSGPELFAFGCLSVFFIVAVSAAVGVTSALLHPRPQVTPEQIEAKAAPLREACHTIATGHPFHVVENMATGSVSCYVEGLR